MHLLSIDRISGHGNTLAIACVQLTPEIRVNGLRLVRSGSGDLRVYSPNANGLSVLSFAPKAVTELKSLMIEAYRSETADECNRAA